MARDDVVGKVVKAVKGPAILTAAVVVVGMVATFANVAQYFAVIGVENLVGIFLTLLVADKLADFAKKQFKI